MIETIVLSLTVTIIFTLGFQRLLPKAPNWLTVVTVGIIFPTLFVLFELYSMLVVIGRTEAITGRAPPNVVSDFSEALERTLASGAVWSALAIATSLIAIKISDNLKQE